MHRFADKIRGRVGPAAETAAEEFGVDFHLFGFKPGDLAGDHLIEGLELGAGPDFTFVRGDFHRAIERFHWRVGQVRHTVFDVDGFRRFAQRRSGITGLTGRHAGGRGELAEAFQQFHAVEPGVRPQVPVDFQRIAAQFRRPVVIGNHRHARGHLHHFVHTLHCQRLGAFEGFDAAAEHRRARNHRSHQPFKLHVHAEPGPAGDFLRSVEPFGRFADDFPVLGVLELDRGRVRHGQLAGVIGQFAVGRAFVAGDDHARFGVNLGRCNVETLGGGVDQHQPRGGTRLAIAVELHPG